MAVRSTCWLPILAVALAACGGATEPGDAGRAAVRVSLTATSDPYINYTADGVASIACALDLKAVANGSAPAIWKGAVFRWYLGDDLSMPFDTATVPVDLVQQSWGGAGGIGSSAAQFARWNFSATVPFTAELAFRYQVGSGPEEVTAPVRALCSPPVPDNPGPVAVSSVSLATRLPEVEAGRRAPGAVDRKRAGGPVAGHRGRVGGLRRHAALRAWGTRAAEVGDHVIRGAARLHAQPARVGGGACGGHRAAGGQPHPGGAAAGGGQDAAEPLAQRADRGAALRWGLAQLVAWRRRQRPAGVDRVGSPAGRGPGLGAATPFGPLAPILVACVWRGSPR
ncbi:MAG: hypothetical protein IPK12_20750 [Gemmatimonadetes bacterium]|nr:hypothetical protein [Gemmatimonadota bacterium]